MKNLHTMTIARQKINYFWSSQANNGSKNSDPKIVNVVLDT